MKKIQLNKKVCGKISQGYPLIQKMDLLNPQEKVTSEWVTFYSPQNEYLGTGYLGVQNKGIGWVLSRVANEAIDLEFFQQSFAKALAKRHDLVNNPQTTAYRLFNGEGDGVGGMTLDIYNQFAVISWYNQSIYQHRELITAALIEAVPMIKGLYEKNRFESQGIVESQHIFGEVAPEPLLVLENGVTFATYLNEGMMTGIFLDQKDVRGRLVAGMASGMSVLNTFSYTGAFSVAAARGGATSTVSVDLAKRSLPKTKEMIEVNDLSLEANKIVVMDVFDYFNYAKRKGMSFDMIILDPPSFARSKKRTFSVAQNYGELVADVAGLINSQGWLIASTNAANVSLDKYQKMVEQGLKSQGRKFKLTETHRLPQDYVINHSFKEGNYLKVLIYQLD